MKRKTILKCLLKIFGGLLLFCSSMQLIYFFYSFHLISTVMLLFFSLIGVYYSIKGLMELGG